MQGRVEKKNEHLAGVKCVVNTCYYHAQGDYCNAEKLKYSPITLLIQKKQTVQPLYQNNTQYNHRMKKLCPL